MSVLTMNYLHSNKSNNNYYEERLCKYCNSTVKNERCRIFGHVDGCTVKLSRFQIQRENERRESHNSNSSYGNIRDRINSNTCINNFNRTSTVESTAEHDYRPAPGALMTELGITNRYQTCNGFTAQGNENECDRINLSVSNAVVHQAPKSEVTPCVPVTCQAPQKVYFDISKPKAKTNMASGGIIIDSNKRDRDIAELDNYESNKKIQVPPLPAIPAQAPVDQGYQPYLPPPPPQTNNPLPLEPLWPTERLNLSALTSSSKLPRISTSELKHSISDPALAKLSITIPADETIAVGKESTPSALAVSPHNPANPRWAASLNRLKSIQESQSNQAPHTMVTTSGGGDVSEVVNSKWLLAADEHSQREKYRLHKLEKERQQKAEGGGQGSDPLAPPPAPLYVETPTISTYGKLQAVKGIIKKDRNQKSFEVVPVGRNKKTFTAEYKTDHDGSSALQPATIKVFTIPMELIRSLAAIQKPRKIRWKDMAQVNTSLYVCHEYEQVQDILIDDDRQVDIAYDAEDTLDPPFAIRFQKAAV